ncbi:LPXTG cell wall anchor domain-containing protein [Peribacillus sp. SCS-155]|uniref:LPXTG cell wall anchor domain-containing protein n=1 Tax=Peribacillus sedimenti TaxID=3115297 RepID=UPI0039062EE8
MKKTRIRGLYALSIAFLLIYSIVFPIGMAKASENSAGQNGQKEVELDLNATTNKQNVTGSEEQKEQVESSPQANPEKATSQDIEKHDTEQTKSEQKGAKEQARDLEKEAKVLARETKEQTREAEKEAKKLSRQTEQEIKEQARKVEWEAKQKAKQAEREAKEKARQAKQEAEEQARHTEREAKKQAREAEKGSHQNKATEIHLHLKKCAKLVKEVSVQIGDKWFTLSNPGSSPLYKMKDGGEFVKDDVKAFKLVTLSGKELVVTPAELRVGVEANGTINYWFEQCSRLIETEPPAIPPADDQQSIIIGKVKLILDGCKAPIQNIKLVLKNETIIDLNSGTAVLEFLLQTGVDFNKIQSIQVTINGEVKTFPLSNTDKFHYSLVHGTLVITIECDVSADPGTGTDPCECTPPANPGTDPGTGTPPTNPGTDPGTSIPPTNPGTDPGTSLPPTNPGTDPGTSLPPTDPGTGTDPGTVTPPAGPGTGIPEPSIDTGAEIPTPTVPGDEEVVIENPEAPASPGDLGSDNDNGEDAPQSEVISDITSAGTALSDDTTLQSGTLPKTGESSRIGFYIAGSLLIVLGALALRSRKIQGE